MVPRPIRARSNTAASSASNHSRPVSRASTTSANTQNERPQQSYQHQHVPESSHTITGPASIDPHGQYTPEEMITRSQQQLTNPNQGYAIDPSLQEHLQPPPRATSTAPSYHGLADMPVQPLGHHEILDASNLPLNHLHSFQDNENQSFASVIEDQTQDEAGAGEAKKKKGSASSIANDQELKRLYQDNKHRDLRDVADSVLAEERGPRSEKTKQIFAMIWLNTVCRKGTGSVPRNRVFSYYATRCGNERVPPLNPASFGKLVRIIFPGIQTRRLGMRGESKYHYVDLEMAEDAPECQPDGGISQFDGFVSEAMGRGSVQRQRVHPPADTAVFPPPNTSANPNSTDQNHTSTGHGSKGYLYLNPNIPTLHRGPSMPNMASRDLKFPTSSESQELDDQQIELPSLQGYMPPGTDQDAADALRALYRTHCIAVIDGFRYCKEKTFYHSFTSFHGTLTVPVQKLLAYPGLAPWIKECDWLMYQKMIRFVAPLALQAMPVRVIETFRTISHRLGPHILSTFQHHPAHVRDARHGPAVIFASLLDRLLRVNATAHAAANILTDSLSRNQMWFDWVYFVKPVTIVETSLPGVGYTRTLQILTNEIRELLAPLQSATYEGMQPIYAHAAAEKTAEIAHQMHTAVDSSSTEGVLDRWNNFLTKLPSRFPHADARTLIQCVGQVASAALRDITMADAKSFGYWCVTKTWVEEMLQWLAEKGGFLERSPQSMTIRPQKRTAHTAGLDFDGETHRHPNSRPRTGYGEGVGQQSHYGSPEMIQGFDQMPNNASFHPQNSAYRPPLNSHQYPSPNGHQNGGYRPPHNDQFDPNGMNIPNGKYAGQDISQQQPAYEQQTQSTPSRPDPATEKPSAVPPHLAPDADPNDGSNGHNNDDSGIGLDLELPPQRTPLKVANYDAFMNNTTTASDPADVVVC